jgi:mono/diheme cytochrome c family protein
MIRSLSLLAILLLGLLLGACAAHSDLPPNPDQLISQGQNLYWEQCSRCHQRDGKGWGKLFPRLAGNPIVTLHDPEPIIVIVQNGQGSMPSFRQTLTAQEKAAILSYIRNAWGNQATAVSPRLLK